MPAYQLYVYEAQEKREALEQKICEQVDACTEVNGTIRNRVKKFLIEEGITDISEMDAVLRVLYEEYLERNETVLAPITCLRGFDGIVIHRMKEELQTLAGRRNYTTEYREQWMCLSHYPEIEIAESFLASKDGKELLWNFTMECPRNLKMQIFTVLKEVIHTYQGCYRKENPADEQKNPIFTGTGNSLECECVVFGTFPFFQRTNESKQARGMGIL